MLAFAEFGSGSAVSVDGFAADCLDSEVSVEGFVAGCSDSGVSVADCLESAVSVVASGLESAVSVVSGGLEPAVSVVAGGLESAVSVEGLVADWLDSTAFVVQSSGAGIGDSRSILSVSVFNCAKSV